MNHEAATTPASISPLQRYLWCLRREIWENRSIYIGPLAVAVLITLLSIIHAFHGFGIELPHPEADRIHAPYDFIGGLMMITAMVVGLFYCLDALYGERRDRSILFWKSLPVSDLTTVLAKMTVPLFILPVIATAAAAIADVGLALSTMVGMAARGMRVAAYWRELSLLRELGLLFYHMVTVHGLWCAPIFGWLLLVSAWAKRAPLLWATLPLLAMGFGEKIVFNTTHFGGLLLHVVGGAGADDRSAIVGSPNLMPTNPMTHITPLDFLGNPQLWLGFAVAGMFLAAAVQMRRRREPV